MYHYRALIILLASSLASAQLPNLPQCSLNCFIDAFQKDGCSSLLDFGCHCQKPQVVQVVTPCVQKACNAADQSAVSSEVIRQCSAAGHPITIPPVAGAETTTAAQPSASDTNSKAEPTNTGAVSLPTVSSAVTPTVPKSTPGASTTASRGSSSIIQASSSGPAGSSSQASPSTPLATGAGSHAEANLVGAALAAAAAAYIL
ncbi:CFEM domain-containing protein [Aspergillus homomorphus CBS 101889]|uniref:CFEM-domain-containing protein n=1 Tax=Aspergillus homomorphus (strain CBS 101889) TaxID=1450537 RepID=A0A395I6Q4_ASPHC|nr:CFEM-domain-containing protein [Aspergillus homomorphus CBS 101889]RAL15747.1 CFEM-domain-containing protein [Aspergillus homomorphus CBS 101889]